MLGGWDVFLLCPNVFKGVFALCEWVCVLEVCVFGCNCSLAEWAGLCTVILEDVVPGGVCRC